MKLIMTLCQQQMMIRIITYIFTIWTKELYITVFTKTYTLFITRKNFHIKIMQLSLLHLANKGMSHFLPVQMLHWKNSMFHVRILFPYSSPLSTLSLLAELAHTHAHTEKVLMLKPLEKPVQVFR